MTTETAQTETPVVSPAQPLDSQPTPTSETPKTEAAPPASPEAPAVVLEEPAPAPSEPEQVAPGYEFQQEPTEDTGTPPVASRPCPAGPSSRHHRENPYGRA